MSNRLDPNQDKHSFDDAFSMLLIFLKKVNCHLILSLFLPFTQDNFHLLSHLLMNFDIAYIASNMDPDQTAALGAV